jgi:hypothetical protein
VYKYHHYLRKEIEMFKEQKTNIFVPSILAVLVIFSVGLKTSTLYASPDAPFYQVQTVPFPVPPTGEFVFIKNTDGVNSWAGEDPGALVTVGINDNTDSQGLGVPDGGFSGSQGAVVVYNVSGEAGNGAFCALSSVFPTSEGGPGASGLPLNLNDVVLRVDIAFDVPGHPEITSLTKALNFWVQEVDGDNFEESSGIFDLSRNWQTYEYELDNLPLEFPNGGVFGDSSATLVSVEFEDPDSPTGLDTIIYFVDNFRLEKSGDTLFFEDFESSVIPATPAVMLAETALFIMDEVDSGNIAPELEGSLLAKINAALAALDRGNPNDAKVAMNDLKALINQIEAQVNKKITPEAAAEIIDRTNAIIAELAG